MVGRVAIPLPQAEAALRTGLFRVTAFCEGKAVGMGRLVRDGAMYWYIQGMAVLSEYQGRGIEKSSQVCTWTIPGHRQAVAKRGQTVYSDMQA